jgi:hypothetical protein
MLTRRRLGVSGLWLTALALMLGQIGAARAAVMTVTFEGLKNGESVNNFYNGGLGGSGSGPGPTFGVVFTSNALAFISDQHGGTLNSDANALPSPDTAMVFLTGAAATMNVAAGFTTGFSFFYSAINVPGAINVWSGLNATGSLLATLNLPVTPAVPNGRFQPFAPIGVSFVGTAMSVDFGGTQNQITFDNITIGSQTPTSNTPEPTSVALFGIGAVGIAFGAARRRRQKPVA